MAIKYEWSEGLPVKVDSTNFEWSEGLPYINYERIVKIFEDSGSGVDVFLRDKMNVVFEDTGVGVDVFKASYPYPRDLKRKIIIIRDIK